MLPHVKPFCPLNINIKCYFDRVFNLSDQTTPSLFWILDFEATIMKRATFAISILQLVILLTNLKYHIHGIGVSVWFERKRTTVNVVSFESWQMLKDTEKFKDPTDSHRCGKRLCLFDLHQDQGLCVCACVCVSNLDLQMSEKMYHMNSNKLIFSDRNAIFMFSGWHNLASFTVTVKKKKRILRPVWRCLLWLD